MDADLGEFRQQRLELLPDPAAEVFAGGVFQAWNIVQIIVVELLVDRLEDRLDFREVADPAGMRIDLAFDVDGDTERVAVQAPGKPLSRKPNREEVLDAISGYAPALDLTLREVQAKLKEKGLPWELAKSFDGAGVLSPFVNADQFPDPTDIGIRLTINGEVRQDGNSRDMLNPIVPLIQHIAGHFSLQAGDVVLTGTPSGVGVGRRGDCHG